MLTELGSRNGLASAEAADRSQGSPAWPIDYITVVPSLDRAVPGIRSTSFVTFRVISSNSNLQSIDKNICHAEGM